MLFALYVQRTSLRMWSAAALICYVVLLQQRCILVTSSSANFNGNQYSQQQQHLDGGGGSKVFCYYSTYAQNRPDAGQFLPEDIDPLLCTHIVMAFADIIQGTQLKASGWNDLPNGKDNGLYARTQALKRTNPRLKVLLAVGGWRAGSEPFVSVVNSESNRKLFAENAASFIRRHGFDGLDIDWEFPGSRGSGPEHKPLFTALLKDLREAFEAEAVESNQERLLLTMAAAGGSYYIELAYEPSKIIKYVDYLLVMAYNYHGSWNQFTGHHSGLFARSDEVGGEREWNQAWTIDYWLNKAGAPREKVIIGISTYGTTFTLASSSQHGLKAATTGPGEGGKYTKEAGTLAYYEICDNLRNGWTTVWLDEQKVPYAYKDDQWVGYDNLDSVTYKAKYLRQKGVGGAFIWSLEMDDFRGSCGTGKYPLLTAINSVMTAQQSSANSGLDSGVSDDRQSGRSRDFQSTRPRQQPAPSELSGRTQSSSAVSRFSGSSDFTRNGDFGNGDVAGNSGRFSQSDDVSSGRSSQQLQSVRPHRSEYIVDDVTPPGNGRRQQQLASSQSDDVINPNIGRRVSSSSTVSRQDSVLTADNGDDINFRSRKFFDRTASSSGGSGSAWDDGSDANGQPHQHLKPALQTTRRNDEQLRSRHSDVIDTDSSAQDSFGSGRSIAAGSRTSTGFASSLAADNEGSGCTTSGVFVKPGTNCHAYYVCVQHGTSWHQFHMTCPQGTTFRTDLAACSDAVAGGAVSGGRTSTCTE